MIRFYAHLCLALRLLQTEAPIDFENENTILDAYTDILQIDGQGILVATYTSALGAGAVNKYAEYLAGMDVCLNVLSQVR